MRSTRFWARTARASPRSSSASRRLSPRRRRHPARGPLDRSPRHARGQKLGYRYSLPGSEPAAEPDGRGETLLGRQPRRFGLVSRTRTNADARALLQRYGLAIDVARSLESYSVAIQQIIAIARAVACRARSSSWTSRPPVSTGKRSACCSAWSMRSARKASASSSSRISSISVFDISDRVTVLRNGRLVGSRDVAGLDRTQLINMMLGRELAEETRDSGKTASTTPGPPRFSFRGTRPQGRDRGLRSERASRRGRRRRRTSWFRPQRNGGNPVRGSAARCRHRREGRQAGGALLPTAMRSPAGFGFLAEDRKTSGNHRRHERAGENIALALQARQGWLRPISAARQRALADDYIRRLDIRRPTPRSDRRTVGRQPAEGAARPLARDQPGIPDPGRADARDRCRRACRDHPAHRDLVRRRDVSPSHLVGARRARELQPPRRGGPRPRPL